MTTAKGEFLEGALHSVIDRHTAELTLTRSARMALDDLVRTMSTTAYEAVPADPVDDPQIRGALDELDARLEEHIVRLSSEGQVQMGADDVLEIARGLCPLPPFLLWRGRFWSRFLRDRV